MLGGVTLLVGHLLYTTARVMTGAWEGEALWRNLLLGATFPLILIPFGTRPAPWAALRKKGTDPRSKG